MHHFTSEANPPMLCNGRYCNDIIFVGNWIKATFPGFRRLHQNLDLNPFLTNVPLLCTLKTPANQLILRILNGIFPVYLDFEISFFLKYSWPVYIFCWINMDVTEVKAQFISSANEQLYYKFINLKLRFGLRTLW